MLNVKIDKSLLLKDLKSDLRDSTAYKTEQDSKINTWRKEYKGDPYGNESKGKSAYVSKDIKKQVEWLHPNLVYPFISTKDIVRATPITYEDVACAKQAEHLLNFFFCRGGAEFNRFKFLDKLVRVLQVEGTAIIRTSWLYEEKTVTVVEQVMSPEGIPMEYEVEKQIPAKNRPIADIVRTEDIFLDPTADGEINQSQFVIYRYETDLSSLKKDSRYSNLDSINPDRTSLNDVSILDRERSTFKFSDKARQKLVVYEYWGNYDINNDGITEPIVCSWTNDTIIRLEENPYPDKEIPFIVVPYKQDPFNLYGEPDGELISPLQKTKSALIRGMIDNMVQSNNGQKGVRAGSLDPVNLNKFINGDNFMFLGNKDDFFDGNYNQIPNSIFSFYELMSHEIDAQTGVKAFTGGAGSSSFGSSNASMRGVLDSTAKRELHIIKTISELGIKPLLRKWLAYSSEFLDEEYVISITSEEFVPIKKEDLKGDIDISLEISTVESNNTKAEELAFMLQTIGNSVSPAFMQMILSEIAALRNMPDLSKQIKEYQPEPDPMQQQMQQMQLQQMQLQLAELQSKIQENQADYILKTAKAKDMSASADNKNLDFMEKYTGAKYEREENMNERGYKQESDKHIIDIDHKERLHNEKLNKDSETKIISEALKLLKGQK